MALNDIHAFSLSHLDIADTYSPMGSAVNQPDLLLNGRQIGQLFDFIVQTRQEGKIQTSFTCDGFTGKYEGIIRDYHCEAGINVGSVLIDSSISACNSIRSHHIQGNIYKDDFNVYILPGQRHASV